MHSLPSDLYLLYQAKIHLLIIFKLVFKVYNLNTTDPGKPICFAIKINELWTWKNFLQNLHRHR